MKNINIKFTIDTLEDFHIGSGLEKIGVCDDGQYKDNDNKPAIKSETFKGLLKQSCRELKNIKLYSKDLFDKIFNFDNQNSIDVEIKLKEEVDNPLIVHTFTSVEQKTKRAKDSSLHNIEFASKGIKFCGEINFLAKDDADKVKEFLEKGLKNLKWWGGYRRRGFGAIKIDDIESNILENNKNNEDNKNVTTKLSLILELREDVTIAGKASAGNIIETLDYIPATSILGMTRFVLMSTQNEIFDYLDDNNIKVSNFYPIPNDYKKEEVHNAFIAPIPLSLRQNKATEIQFGANFKVKNIPHWALKKENKIKFSEMVRQDSLIENSSASQDDGSDKSFNGGYIYTPLAPQSPKGDGKKSMLINSTYTTVKKELSMRNHIDKKTQSSKKEGGLFSQEKIKKGTKFKGEMLFDNDKDAKNFKEHFADYLSGKRNFHVGRGGKPVKVVGYKFLPNSDTYPAPEAKHLASTTSQEGNTSKFTITFISDVILFDDNLNRVKSLTTEILAKKLKLNKDDLSLKSKVDSTRVIQNYNGLSGLRRFSDIAIKKGSAYCFEYKGSEDISEKLSDLEKDGLGIRNFEGFGDIKVNYFIHSAKNSSNKAENKLEKLKEAKLSKHYKDNLEKNHKLYEEANDLNLDDKNTKTVVNNLISIIEANKNNLEKVDIYLAKQLNKTTIKDKYQNFKKIWDKYPKNSDIPKEKVFILALEKLKGGK